MLETSKSKIHLIFEQFILNIQSVELFFKKFSIQALEEDKSILESKRGYMEKVFKKALGEEAFDKVMSQINNEKLEAETKEILVADAETITEEYKEVISESTNDQEVSSHSKKYSDSKYLDLIFEIDNAPKLQTKNYEILTSSSFLMINNYFEFLFADLLTFHFTNTKNAIEEKSINISLSELKNYSTIEEAYNEILFKEVEKLLIDMNFEEIKGYFKKLDVSLSENLINWEKINEIRERRHLVVHNNSIINKKYIGKTENPYNFKIGDSARINNDYLIETINEIQTAGVLLIIDCWGKWEKGNATEAILEILNLTFDLLKEKKYNLTLKICEYVEKNIAPRNDDQENCIIRIKFNYCIALKRIEELKKLDKKLEELRVGSMSPIFKIAKHILNDENELAITLIKQSIIVDELKLEDYLEWPIFEELRNDKDLNSLAREQFNEVKLLN
jgi:hypothetical protein